MSKTTTVAAAQLRVVPLSKINVVDGFNPRTDVERSELDKLADSICLHGILVPVVLRPDGGDEFALVAGGRRIAAAAIAGLREVPAVVRETGEESDGFELALLENIAREDLNPVEEALAFKRLLDRGLTRKGIAQTLSIAQKRVTERLELLELPEELRPRVADGAIPPSAIRPLAKLAKIHPGLPAVAVARIDNGPLHQWDEPTSWQDLVEQPISVACAAYPDQLASHPSDVYEPGYSYPASRFTLSERAQKDLAAFCKLNGSDAESFTVQFGSHEVDQAAALGAAFADREPSAYGATLIVGQDVADQLAGDFIARLLKERRAQQRRERDWERQRQRRDLQEKGIDPDSPGAAAALKPPSEEELAERRKREREQAAERKRAAVAHNLELGAACFSKLSKVKLDERVVKILATVDLYGDLGRIATRGARYGFPDWPEEVALKTPGKTKIEYLPSGTAEQRAREFLAGAKSASEIAGRSIALLAMARYASEECVAQSAQSYYTLSFSTGRLPWSGEVLDLLDEIAGEKLPAHLIEPVVSVRREQLKREKAIVRQKAVRDKATDQLIKKLPSLSPEEREAAVAEFVAAEEAIDDWAVSDYGRRRRVDQALAELTAEEQAATVDEAAESADAQACVNGEQGSDGDEADEAEPESAAA